mgnify:CR=1 FL=1
MRIGVVAPSCPLRRDAAEAASALATARDVELVIHPQCFLQEGHFAGSDEARLSALREMMGDPSLDAIWFARGGYGSNRIAADRLPAMAERSVEGLLRLLPPPVTDGDALEDALARELARAAEALLASGDTWTVEA